MPTVFCRECGARPCREGQTFCRPCLREREDSLPLEPPKLIRENAAGPTTYALQAMQEEVESLRREKEELKTSYQMFLETSKQAEEALQAMINELQAALSERDSQIAELQQAHEAYTDNSRSSIEKKTGGSPISPREDNIAVQPSPRALSVSGRSSKRVSKKSSAGSKRGKSVSRSARGKKG